MSPSVASSSRSESPDRRLGEPGELLLASEDLHEGPPGHWLVGDTPYERLVFLSPLNRIFKRSRDDNYQSRDAYYTYISEFQTDQQSEGKSNSMTACND